MPAKGATAGKVLKDRVDSSGYLIVSLSKNGTAKKKYVHILVCEAFNGPKPTAGHEVNHKGKRTGKKWNYYRNLEWATRSQNVLHSHRVLGNKNPRGAAHPRSKEFIVTNPEGKAFRIVGLNDFCKKHGLGTGAMFGVASGVCSHHKGWRCERGNN